jgi:hypothetical protein
MRSTFLGMGLFVLLCGSLFLFTQQVEIQPHQNLGSLSGWWTSWDDGQAVFHPPEWAAFSLLSAGALMMLYAVGLPHPQRKREPKLSIPLLEALHDPHNELARSILNRSLIPARATSSPLFLRRY